MPIYEYACDSCGHRFERLVRIAAEPPPCPECASAVRKLVSQSGFILRGGGWYKDHYGLKKAESSGEGASKKSEEAGGTAKGGESTKSTESAPAAAPSPSTDTKPKTKAATSAAAAK